MLAYIFILEGAGKIAKLRCVAGYMQAHGLTAAAAAGHSDRTGGGLLVLFGLKTRLGGGCALRLLLADALFFHTPPIRS